jgi:NADH-quinone oxidoreductase subunit N
MYQIDIFQNHLKLIIPEIFLLTGIIILLVYAVIYNAMAYYKFPILTSVIGWLSIHVLAITILLITNQNASIPFSTTSFASAVILNNVLIIDAFSIIIKIIILLSALASIMISLDYIKKQKINSFEYMILILFSTWSMLFIVSSYDLISMYLAIELQSLAFYVLASFRRNDEFSTEAGLKYFILGALSSGLLLFGESILYGFTGITNFEEFAKFSTLTSKNVQALYKDSDWLAFSDYIFVPTNAIIIGLLFILVACLFKLSAAPFHMWTPDVYEGAPTSVTAFFAITPKIAILALLLRLCLYTFFDFLMTWQYIIIFSAVSSILIGTFGALNQNKIKRLFAYSSIAHVGYILIGFATASIQGIQAVLIYIILYIPILVGTFSAILTMSKYNFKMQAEDNLAYEKSLNPIITSTSFIFGISKTNLNKKISNASTWCYNSATGTNANLSTCTATILEGPWEKERLRLKASYPIWNTYDSIHDRFLTQSRRNCTNIGAFTKIKKKESFIKYITDLASLGTANRLLAITVAILLFSNAGVPPLAGFYGKVNVFLVAVESSMYFLAIFGVLLSVIGAFYSIRLVKIIYFHGLKYGIQANTWTWYTQINKLSSVILGITLLFTLFFFLFPSFLFTWTHLGALSLCL